MTSKQGPKCRKCRRERQKLFLKGDKCFTSKCPVEKRNNVAPGQHGQRHGRLSDYGVMLREKQKLRNIYGVLEGQFRNYYKEAEQRKGATGQNLLIILESRLDNVVYRMGFGASRSESRQLIAHRLIKVNGHVVNIPAYEVKVGDEISLNLDEPHLRIKTAARSMSDRGYPEWLDVDSEKCVGLYKVQPQRSDLAADIQEHLVVEFYSK